MTHTGESSPLDVHIKYFEETYKNRNWLIRRFEQRGWKYFSSSSPRGYTAEHPSENACICYGYGDTVAEAFTNMRRATDNYEQQKRMSETAVLRGIQP